MTGPWAISALFACLAALGATDAADAASRSRPDRAPSIGVEWIRAGLNTNRPVWGIRGGLLWGLPAGQRPPDGPRGLIRLFYPVLTNGACDLINFIAIEPVVGNRKGFSELERSALDGVAGKRLWALEAEPADRPDSPLQPGRLSSAESGAQQLRVEAGVERFENGAQVRLALCQRSDAPDELELIVHAEPESAPIDYCVLTATMGNKARARLLWLRDGVENSLQLYPDYRGLEFAPHRFFSLARLHRTGPGEIMAAITTDEAAPAQVEPFPGRSHWRYAGAPVTQYWKKPAGAWRSDLHLAVNGRFTYWMSRQPIPGGVAFENFEMRERFQQGQRFIFGITRRTPVELGFPTPKAARSGK
jgi:hypothetical protein